MPEIISINKSQDPTNPAAMADVIEKLIAAKYASPDWVRQGPNFIVNKTSGQAVNLNQEASDILQDQPLRQDTVAVVQNDDGAHEVIWVDQSALQAAGGDLQVLKKNLNATLQPGMSPVTMALLLAGAVGLVWVLGKK